MPDGTVERRHGGTNGSGPSGVKRRVDLPCAAAGFSPPPTRVELRFQLADDGTTTLVARAPPAQPPEVARWLEDYGPAAIEIEPGLAPKTLRATFDEVPDAWRRLLSPVNVRFAALTPDGTASLFVEGQPAEVDRFTSILTDQLPRSDGTGDVRTRPARWDGSDVSLTARQLEVLSRAVALGYYEIPHNLTLRELADHLDLTVGTVSELLRRAESAIVTSYVDSWMASRWNGQSEEDLEGWTLTADANQG